MVGILRLAPYAKFRNSNFKGHGFMPSLRAQAKQSMADAQRKNGLLRRIRSSQQRLEYWDRPVKPGDDGWIHLRIPATLSRPGFA
jgi:hypothetical protein